MTLLLLDSLAICQPADAPVPRVTFVCCMLVYTGRLPRSPPKQAGNGLQDKPYPNRPGSALTIVVAVPVAVEEAEAADMIARLKSDGTSEAAKAVLADVTEIASTLWAASVQCGIVAGARSLGSLAQAQCMVKCC